MIPRDKAQFAAFVAGIAEVYDKRMSEAAISIYWDTLKDLELSEVRSAFKRHLEDADGGRFMPRPSDIRAIARPPRDSVMAWSEVEGAMRKVGAYRSVQFQDPVINSVVRDMGGWPWICRQPLEEPWVQKEFERRYLAYRDAGHGDGSRLAGLHEIENRGLLGAAPEVVFLPMGTGEAAGRPMLEAPGRRLIEKESPN